MSVTHSIDAFLRRVLLTDAIFEVVCAVLFILVASTLVIGEPSPLPLLFIILGIGLGAVAVLLFWMQRQTRLNLPLVRLVMRLNALFAVGGFIGILLLWASLADMARLIGVFVVAGLGILAVLEYVGLRRITVHSG